MKYRAEIDGLRALAVLPVILFHAGFELFSGGFVGVDVFFVISGYLITTILIEDIEHDRFSLVNFYERRARRILPALFFVMATCIPFAWMWLLPGQMKDFSQSLVAVSLFASNILFWLEGGYFEAAAEEKPLLHTWSLAVEEQFYLLFPIFLIVAWRFGKNRVFWMIAIMAALSLLLSEWGWRNKASENFYLAPTRAWELFAGSLAALVVQQTGVQKNDSLSLLGLAAIILAIFAYDETTPFPGVYALLPVLGVVLLILFADKATLAARILSTKGFVGIGLISYSAYLWHQPIFAFARILYDEFTPVLMTILVIVSMTCAYFSWRFIEKPFRDRSNFSRTKIFFLSIIFCIAFITLGLLGHFKQGFEDRVYGSLNEKIRAIAVVWHFSNYPPHPLIEQDENGYMRIGEKFDAIASTVIFGDSHALQYHHAIANNLTENSENFADKSVYLKSLPFSSIGSIGSIENLKLPSNTKRVVLVYFWALKLNNPNVNTYIRCCGSGPGGVVGHEYVSIGNVELEKKYAFLETFIIDLKEAGIETVLVLDNPFGEELNAKSLLNFDYGFGLTVSINEKAFTELPTSEALLRREPTAKRLIELAEVHQLKIIDPFDYLCDQSFCNKFSDDGYLIYKDYDHLSLPAIMNEGSYINEVFR
jgi:peptidoglycan/LPS O-acetylase OafA/YrhL